MSHYSSFVLVSIKPIEWFSIIYQFSEYQFNFTTYLKL